MLRSARCYFTQKGVCMKEENATSIEYFRDFRRVADLINGVIFHGKQIVRECDLQEQNPVLHDVTKKNDKVSAIENTPDLSVMPVIIEYGSGGKTILSLLPWICRELMTG